MKRKLFATFLLSLTLVCTPCGTRVPAAAADPPDPTGKAETTPPKAEFEMDPEAHRVVRRDAAGNVRWSTTLTGELGRVRPPHLLWDAEGVFVSHDGGVTALSRGTGKVLWHAKGPSDCMLLSGGLLLAADCTSDAYLPAGGRWLVARAAGDGKEAFRVRLPASDFDPEPIEEVAGLFLVQTGEAPGGKGDALLVDRKGQVRYRFDRQVVATARQGDDYVFLTSRDVTRLSPTGAARWSVPLRHQWIAGGGLIAVQGGDLLAYLFGQISNSGVQVVRLDVASGRAVWEARCDPLVGRHSQYSHDVDLRVEGGRVRVTSRGGIGTFVEILDLPSGRQVERTRHDPP